MEEGPNLSEDMDVDDENTQAGMSAHTFLRNAITEALYDGSLCVSCVCSSNQALDAEESEAESHVPEDMEEMLFAEEETEGSDDELGAHRAGAVPASVVPGRAELDHLDSFERPTEEVLAADGHLEEDKDNMSEDAGDEDTSEEEEVAEPVVQPRRRLRGKQEAEEYGPPSRKVQLRLQEIEHGAPPKSSPVMKRPGMLKRPAGRSPWPNEFCAGFQGVACRFCPMEPGKPARVHPERGMRHCVFCNLERMEAAHGVVRGNVVTAALKKFRAVDTAILDAALERVQRFLGEEAAKGYNKKAVVTPGLAEGWEEALGHRQLVGRSLTQKQQEEYDAAVRRDQRPQAAWHPMTQTCHVQVHRREGC